MTITKKRSFLLFSVLLMGLIVGTILVLALGPTNGPTFYSYVLPQFGFAVNKNLVVVDVIPNSPAEKSGLKKGDVLTKIGRETITLASDLKSTARQEIQANVTPIVNYGVQQPMRVSPVAVVVNRGTALVNLSVTPLSPPFLPANSFQVNAPIPTPTPAPNDFVYM